MFTGIISHLGTITKKTADSLSVKAEKSLMSRLSLGMSVAVNGICLTVVKHDDSEFIIEFMPETAQKTNIDAWNVSDIVNLELPATPETMLAGHIVQGHVDGLGLIKDITKEGVSNIVAISVDDALTKYIVPKGSITINGISLTVISIADSVLTVGIIPHTWQHTNLHAMRKGDYVTIEVDVFAKYVEKLIKNNI